MITVKDIEIFDYEQVEIIKGWYKSKRKEFAAITLYSYVENNKKKFAILYEDEERISVDEIDYRNIDDWWWRNIDGAWKQ